MERKVYVPNSYIFLTIETNDHNPILVDNIKLLQTSLKKAAYFFNYDLFAICILPDHMHLLIKPFDPKDYPNIIKQIKIHFSQNLDLDSAKIESKDKIWKNKYFDYTITTEKDLRKYTDYIHLNPVKHGYVKFAKEWEFSSFHKFVERKYYDPEWINSGNKHKCAELELD